mgnify:FL=1|tara:strand:- start:73 stop:324 length:252 start_codon:yes stop_codon:yes gene_type:complete
MPEAIIFYIYVILATTDVENVKVNQATPFFDEATCVSFVKSNKDAVIDSASQVYDDEIVEMGCVNMTTEEFTAVHKMSLTIEL